MRNLFKAWGLSLMTALSLLAFMAAGAQAENLSGTAGEIKVLASAALATGEAVTGTQEGLGTLLVPSLNIEIDCEKFKVTSGHIVSGPGGTGLGAVLYEECLTYFYEEVGGKVTTLEHLADCIIEPTRHITATATLKAVRHAGVTYVLASGAPFTKVLYKKGVGCILPHEVTISGSVAFTVTAGETNEPLISAANKTIQALLTDKLLFGSNEAFIDGSGKLRLAGKYAACNWGIV